MSKKLTRTLHTLIAVLFAAWFVVQSAYRYDAIVKYKAKKAANEASKERKAL